LPQQFNLASQFSDPDLERALVATIASQPEIYWDILDLLPEEAFTEARQEFGALVTAIEAGQPTPSTTDGHPVEDPQEAARTLADLYQKRQLADLVQRFSDGLRSDIPAGELIAQVEDELARVSQAIRELRAGQIASLTGLLPAVLEDARARQTAVKEGKAVGLPLGIPRADKILGGLQPGVHMVAAEPGAGKASLCLQIGAHVSQKGYPVIFVSFEESLKRLALKTICQVAGLEAKRFSDGYGDPAQLEGGIKEHGKELGNLFLIEGMSRFTVGRLKALALQAMTRAETEKCLVIVDYLQRWAGFQRDSGDFRHVVSGLVSELRELALRLDSPVLVISSQNRGGQGSPDLTSLKESGDLEYSADTVMFLVEEENRSVTPPARAVNLMIKKNRYGDKGTVRLIFRPDIGVFREEVKV
jgi:replicative DNA helicase